MSETAQTGTQGAADGGTLLGGGGGSPGGTAPAADPRAWLPEEFRSDPTFKDYGDLGALAKSHKHLAGMLGVDRAQLLKLPKEPDAPEWGEVYNRLGRPEAPDKYEIQADGMDEAAVGAFRETAHKLGLTNRQAAELMQWYGTLAEGAQGQIAEATQAKAQETVAALKKEWGAAYGERAEAVETVARQFLGENGHEMVNDLIRAGNLPLLNFMAEAATKMLERRGLAGGGDGGMGGAMTPAAAQAEIRALQADPDFASKLMNRDAPGYAAAKDRWDRLHQFAYGAAA